jgi:sulfur-oxidizing protein SoxY
MDAMADLTRSVRATRRQVLAGAGALVGGLGLPVIRPARAQLQANPAALGMAIRKVVGDATVKQGKVKLDVPPLSENGNTVAMSVTVDHPMTPDNYVKAIHVFTEKNPQPNVISVQLGPRAGQASISTRMRLADTQTVTAIAELSDGTFWSDKADVVITLGACLEDTP